MLSQWFTVVSDPTKAMLFVDDIVDSGATKKQWERKYQIPLFALIDRTEIPDWIVFPWEVTAEENEETVQNNIQRILQFLGEDSTREGLVDTPARVVRSYEQLFAGYKGDVAGIFTTFAEDSCDEMVLLRDIEFYSTCEHHMLPFFGKAHIAYIPTDKVIGVSKLARLLDHFARRLQIQERICQQVTDALNTHLAPLGAACILEAQHFCMTARGVQKQHSVMVTNSLTGIFRDDQAARAELLQLVRAR